MRRRDADERFRTAHRGAPAPLGAALMLLLSLVLASGCGQRVTLESWQERIEEHVWAEANGDLGRLRESKVGVPGTALRGFSLIGDPMVDQSTDAHGVLVGRKPVGGTPAMLFLVGLVRQRELQEVRLAAVWPDGERFRWLWGPEDPAAVQRYQAWRAEQWRAAGNDGEPPAYYRGFPGVDDVFRAEVAGDAASAVHVGSGARWSISPEGEATAAAARPATAK